MTEFSVAPFIVIDQNSYPSIWCLQAFHTLYPTDNNVLSSCSVGFHQSRFFFVHSIWCLQAFHTLYHTDNNVLLGAPTGSGKTISAELAMLRVFRHHPGMKTIYIAPLKV